MANLPQDNTVLGGYLNSIPLIGPMITDAYGGSEPIYNQTPLDAATYDLINQQRDLAAKTPEEISQAQLAGTSSQLAPSMGEHQLRAAGTLGGTVDPNMSSALQSRAQRLYGEDYNQIRRQSMANAPLTQANQQNQAFRSINQAQNIGTQQNEQLADVTFQRQALRNQAINNLFGAAGSAGGQYMADRNARNNNNSGGWTNNSGESSQQTYNNSQNVNSNGFTQPKFGGY